MPMIWNGSAAAWRGRFAKAFHLNLRSGCPLPRHADARPCAISGSTKQQRNARRPRPWHLARDLARIGRAFELRTWPLWRRDESPPADASSLDRALFYLHRHHGRVPNARRLYDLLVATATVDADIAVESRIACLT